MSKEVKRYNLRIVDRYAADGTGGIETHADMRPDPKGRFVLDSDYDALAAERGLLRDALDHIATTARASRTQTRRLRWIEQRASWALSGREYSDAAFDLPKDVEEKNFALRVERNQLRDRVDALLAERDELAKDAERYRWLRQQLLGVSFDWNGEGITALEFELPAGLSIGADCDKNIDTAMQGEQP